MSPVWWLVPTVVVGVVAAVVTVWVARPKKTLTVGESMTEHRRFVQALAAVVDRGATPVREPEIRVRRVAAAAGPDTPEPKVPMPEVERSPRAHVAPPPEPDLPVGRTAEPKHG